MFQYSSDPSINELSPIITSDTTKTGKLNENTVSPSSKSPKTASISQIFEKTITNSNPSPSTTYDSDDDDYLGKSEEEHSDSPTESIASYKKSRTPLPATQQLRQFVSAYGSTDSFNILNSMIVGEKNLQNIENITPREAGAKKTFKLTLNSPIDLPVSEGCLGKLIGKDSLLWLERLLGKIENARVNIPNELIITLDQDTTLEGHPFTIISFPDPNSGIKFTNISRSLPEISIDTIYSEDNKQEKTKEAALSLRKPTTVNGFLTRAALKAVDFSQYVNIGSVDNLIEFWTNTHNPELDASPKAAKKKTSWF